jgi:hypothetical protein
MWEQEARDYLQGYITGGTIFTGDLIGLDEQNTTAIAIVIMSDGLVPAKAVEKYFFLAKRNDVISFYEMDRLPSRV